MLRALPYGRATAPSLSHGLLDYTCRLVCVVLIQALARDALVNSTSEVLNYSGSEKRSVAINDC